MSAKQIAFDQEARDAMRKGISKLAKAVKVTLGPKGRNVIIQKSFGSPTVTKDGVTVAKEVDLPDHYENMGARMVREVASKTSDVAGDGTTTATVLAEAIFNEGLKAVVAGTNPMLMKRGMEQAVEDILLRISELVCEMPDIGSIDLNPVIVTERGAVVVDARLGVMRRNFDCSDSPCTKAASMAASSGRIGRTRATRPSGSSSVPSRLVG